MNNEIKVNLEQLKEDGEKMKKASQDLMGLKERMDKAMSTLSTEGWVGKGEEAFQRIVDEQLGEMMRQYAELMETLSKIVNEVAIAQYNTLAEEAKKLVF